MSTYEQDSDYIQVCRRALANLLTTSEVVSTLIELNGYDLFDLSVLSSPNLQQCIERLGCMVQGGDYDDVIEEVSETKVTKAAHAIPAQLFL